MGTRRYIASKVLQALLTLAFVMVFNFFLFRVIPGDPAALLLRGTAAFNPQNVAEVTQELGLDKPLPQQFLVYAAGHPDAQLRGFVLPQGPGRQDRDRRAHLADDAPGRDLDDRLRRARPDHRHLRRVAAREQVRRRVAGVHVVRLLDAGVLVRDPGADGVRRRDRPVPLAVPGRRVLDAGGGPVGLRTRVRRPQPPRAAVVRARRGLHGRVLADHAQLADRRDERRLRHDGPGQGRP